MEGKLLSDPRLLGVLELTGRPSDGLRAARAAHGSHVANRRAARGQRRCWGHQTQLHMRSHTVP